MRQHSPAEIHNYLMEIEMQDFEVHVDGELLTVM